MESRESKMVVIERADTGKPTIWCDPEIVDLVTALNAGGIRTIASCSGHGYRPGSIALDDGRWLVIANDDAEHDKIEAIFPIDINGDRLSALSPRVVTDEIARYASRCRGMSEGGKYEWWSRLAEILEAALPSGVREALDGNRELPLDRETLGRMVREAWVRWAQTQPNPKPSWLVPYDELSEPDKEADRQIGEAVARWTLIHDAAHLSASPSPQRVKPLEWVEIDPHFPIEARTILGTYKVWDFDGKDGHYMGPSDVAGARVEGGLAEAKAAAQADYERRIMSAIEVSASPRVVTDEMAMAAARVLAVVWPDAFEDLSGAPPYEGKPNSLAIETAKRALTAALSSPAPEVETLIDQVPDEVLFGDHSHENPNVGKVGSEPDIADAVLAWMVKREWLDAGRTYDADDVIKALDDNAGPEVMSEQELLDGLDKLVGLPSRPTSADEPGAVKPAAYIVHAPEDDYYGTGPDQLQFHPLTQHDLNNGYRQTPLFLRPNVASADKLEVVAWQDGEYLTTDQACANGCIPLVRQSDATRIITEQAERIKELERSLADMQDHIAHADAYQSAAMENLARAEAAEADRDRMKEALEAFASEENWRQGGPMDPNSPSFVGIAVARAALNGGTEK